MPSKQKASLLLVAIIFGLVGILPLLGGLYVYYERTKFTSLAQEATGNVTEIFLATRKRSGAHERKSYAPKVRFNSSSGEVYEFKASASSSDPGYRVGDQVSVLYDPLNPTDAKINTFFHLWLFPVILTSIGTLFTLIALIVLIIDFKEKQNTNGKLETQ